MSQKEKLNKPNKNSLFWFNLELSHAILNKVIIISLKLN